MNIRDDKFIEYMLNQTSIIKNCLRNGFVNEALSYIVSLEKLFEIALKED